MTPPEEKLPPSIYMRLCRACSHSPLCKLPSQQVYRTPLLWLTVAFIAGIKLGQVGSFPPAALWAGLLAALLSAFVVHSRGSKRLSGGLALLTMGLFGVAYASLNRPPERDALADAAVRKSEPIAVRCLIRSAAIWKPNPNYRPADPNSQRWRTQWDVQCESVRDGQNWIPVQTLSSLIVEGRIDDFYPGDVIQVFGSFRQIVAPTNPGAFDFARHYRQDAQFIVLSANSRSQLEWVDTRSGYLLSRCRAWLVKQVDQSLHEWVAFGQAPLAAALVFGQREQVDWEDQQELMATGTLHLLAISGMHVEIVAGVVLLCAAPFAWRNRTLLLAIVVVCGCYAALAGGKPPVLRAVLVVSAFALARTLGKQARLGNVLSLAALALLLIRVANVDNVGVHLSFLAVGTIGVFVIHQDRRRQRRSALQSLIEESLGAWTRWGLLCARSLRSMALLSMWVWLFTCPLVWFNFHIIAPIAIPLNVLIAVPLMVSLIAGLLTGLLGWLPPLAWLSGTVCGLGLASIRWMVSIGKSVPWGHVWLPAPPLWWIAGFYLFAAAWLVAFGRSKNPWLAGILGFWILVGVAPFSFGPRGLWGVDRFAPSRVGQTDEDADSHRVRDLRCTFLDVGHGTSVLIEMPTGEVWLYDAGHLGAADRSHQDIAAALWELPTTRVDRLLISHADADHYNATRGLIERFRVDRVSSTRQFWSSDDKEVTELISFLKRRGVSRSEVNSGDSASIGGVSWRALHPRAVWHGGSDNAASLCLLLEYAGKRVLLPGDLEGRGLLDLVNLPPRPCHVLMAPHHGSMTLDPSELLAWCRPQVVVISGSHRAMRPEVREKYATVDSHVGITFRDGAIQVRIDSLGALSVWHWGQGSWSPLKSDGE
jgi:competence protein ComEC